jgi:zinc D-Ala-D-Ala carboxypeptidase
MTKHFSIEELTSTSKTNLLVANYNDAQKHFDNLLLTANMLEEIRDILGVPLRVTSGFRNEALNKAVGGSKTSKHKLGLAADIVPKIISVEVAFNKLMENKPILAKKIIIEKVGSTKWLHCQSKVLKNEELEFYTTSNGLKFDKVV